MAEPHMASSTGGASSVSSPPEKKGSPVRLIVLLVLLVGAIGLVWHDRQVAEPAVEKAYNDLQEFVDASNASGVENMTVLTPTVIQEKLGRQPTSERVDPNGLWKEEYFRYGLVPNRQYICALYQKSGDDWRFVLHLLNSAPEAEDYPKPPEPPSAGEGDAADQPAAHEEPGSEAAKSDEPAKPTEEKAADDKAAEEKAADEKPSEKESAEEAPSKDGDKEPADKKPADKESSDNS